MPKGNYGIGYVLDLSDRILCNGGFNNTVPPVKYFFINQQGTKVL